MTKFFNMLRDDSGASAAEYALILALVGTGIAVAAFNLGGAIRDTINKSTDCINGVEDHAAAGDPADLQCGPAPAATPAG